jgi:hypothetical protein
VSCASAVVVCVLAVIFELDLPQLLAYLLAFFGLTFSGIGIIISNQRVIINRLNELKGK